MTVWSRADRTGREPSPSRTEWKKTIRLWPHKLHGEGHFLAVLEKTGEVPEGYRARSLYGIQKGIAPMDFAAWKEFERESLKKQFDGIFFIVRRPALSCTKGHAGFKKA